MIVIKQRIFISTTYPILKQYEKQNVLNFITLASKQYQYNLFILFFNYVSTHTLYFSTTST
jgi:hypothetical protein